MESTRSLDAHLLACTASMLKSEEVFSLHGIINLERKRRKNKRKRRVNSNLF